MESPPPNAWNDPWIPVWYAGGTVATLSLDTFFRDAHRISAFGEGLTPLDLDALYRLLSILTGMIYRFGSDSEWETALNEVRFPEAAVDEFAKNYAHRFDLVGPQPFLQRGDKTQEDLIAAVPARKTLGDILKPLEQLQPHARAAAPQSGPYAKTHETRRPGRSLSSCSSQAISRRRTATGKIPGGAARRRVRPVRCT